MTQFDRLYARHHRAVRSAVGSILQQAEDREDAMQECWARLYTHLGSGGAVTRAWLIEVARNEARDIRRGARVRKAEELPDAEGLADERACRIVRSGDKSQIGDAILALPDELRCTLEAHLAGMTQERIAAALGISQQAVAKRLKIIVQKLGAVVVKRRG